jgi:hypothetical protein
MLMRLKSQKFMFSETTYICVVNNTTDNKENQHVPLSGLPYKDRRSRWVCQSQYRDNAFHFIWVRFIVWSRHILK